MSFTDLDRSRLSRTFVRLLRTPIAASLIVATAVPAAFSVGMLTPVPMKPVGGHQLKRVVKPKKPAVRVRPPATRSKSTVKKTLRSTAASRKKAAPRVAPKAIPPQSLKDKLNLLTIAPGVKYKFYKGPLTINLLDVDLVNSNARVRPMLAGNNFRSLKDVTDHAKDSRALAAVNANYFKSNGTPLGTLIIDGEWIAGPLFDRVTMGIMRDGTVKIGHVNLHGILRSSNPAVPSVWVNNINQPRRTGARLIAYTRRWGNFASLAYDGTLVAVNAQGEVIDKGTRTMGIPWGGYVLSDRKDSEIARLERGDVVSIDWISEPPGWNDVISAVSGGPMLIRNGNLFVNLKEEHFRTSWASSRITARTAAGVTADNHLLLVTVEGPHTLWDLAKFLRDMGCTEAMNLDGGGSTTMVVNGQAVTRGAKTQQRRVASSIVILDDATAQAIERPFNGDYRPTGDIASFLKPASIKLPAGVQQQVTEGLKTRNYTNFSVAPTSVQGHLFDVLMDLQAGTAMDNAAADKIFADDAEPEEAQAETIEATAGPSGARQRKLKRQLQPAEEPRKNGSKKQKHMFRNPFHFFGKSNG